MSIAILIPVLGRAHRLVPLMKSIELHTVGDHHVMFLCSPGDLDAAVVAEALAPTHVVPWMPERGDYARKINYGAAATTDDWVFTGATDIEFTPGWDQTALEAADAGAGVIGTSDNCNPRTKDARHSTHSLVARWFIEQRGHVLHEGYWHNFVDDELIEVARSLRAYRPSAAVVQHYHPLHHTAPNDDTYERGQQEFHQDRRHFLRRRSKRFR